MCQGYVTCAAIAAIVQASKRTAVNQGTVVCSATAAVAEKIKGMVVDAGAPYLALGDGSTSGEGVRIKEGDGSTASGSFITISSSIGMATSLGSVAVSTSSGGTAGVLGIYHRVLGMRPDATVAPCPKPSDQPRDAARWEECSDLDEKSLTTFCR